MMSITFINDKTDINKTPLIIGNKAYNYTHFFYDGCHRFYLCNGRKDEMTDYGFSEDETYSIELLPTLFYHSCPCRFIDLLDLKTVIPQGRKTVTFIIYGNRHKIDFRGNGKHTVYTRVDLKTA